ncbi:hypothetical protein V6Z11_A12G061300 [Gossypium hirsutum]
MNDFLNSRFTAEEIDAVVQSMHHTKAPGEDGLPDLFYQQFWHIIDRICGKINEWCNCWLSQGVKVIFIKFVLQAIPNYIMSCFLLPKTFCEEIEGVFVRHWW